MTDDLIVQAVVALKAGNKAKARELLATAIKQNREKELAWSWMFSVVDSDEQRIHCLKEVVRINPANLKACEALEKLKTKYTQPPEFNVADAMTDERPRDYIGPSVSPPALSEPGSSGATDRPTQPRPPALPPAVPPTVVVVDRQPAEPEYYPLPSPPASKFTPKRIITFLGMILIIISTFISWKITFEWAGVFYPGGYRQYGTTGVSTSEGLAAASAAALGIILLFAIKGEKTAHLLCSLCAIAAAIAAFTYLGRSKVYGLSNSFAGVDWYEFYTKPGIGITMAIFGAAIALGCFLIPTHERQKADPRRPQGAGSPQSNQDSRSMSRPASGSSTRQESINHPATLAMVNGVITLIVAFFQFRYIIYGERIGLIGVLSVFIALLIFWGASKIRANQPRIIQSMAGFAIVNLIYETGMTMLLFSWYDHLFGLRGVIFLTLLSGGWLITSVMFIVSVRRKKNIIHTDSCRQTRAV